MSLSTYLDNKILDHVFGKATYSAPANIYVALSKADPGMDGSAMDEPTGNGYARVQTSAADWTAASARETSNGSKISFPQASGDWGLCTHFALFDAATGGNLLGSAALTTSKQPGNGDTASFDVGELTASLDKA